MVEGKSLTFIHYFLRVFYDLKGRVIERGRDTDLSLSGHSPNGHRGQNYTAPKPEVQSFILASYVGGQVPGLQYGMLVSQREAELVPPQISLTPALAE